MPEFISQVLILPRQLQALEYSAAVCAWDANSRQWTKTAPEKCLA